jgi:hypothetical protein
LDDADEIRLGQNDAAHDDRARNFDLVVREQEQEAVVGIAAIGEALGKGKAQAHVDLRAEGAHDLDKERELTLGSPRRFNLKQIGDTPIELGSILAAIVAGKVDELLCSGWLLRCHEPQLTIVRNPASLG